MCLKNQFLAILVTFVVSCAKHSNKHSPTNQVIIEGIFPSAKSDSLKLHNHLSYEFYIKTDSSGFFNDTLNIAKGYYQISHDYKTLISELFLDDNYKIHLTITNSNDYEIDQKNSMGYFENTYLAKKNIVNQPFDRLFAIADSKNETQFLRFCDSIHNLEQQLFDSTKAQMSEYFRQNEQINLETERLRAIASYPGIINYISKTKVSNSYPNVYSLPIVYGDGAYMTSSNAYLYLNSNINYQVKQLENRNGLSDHQKYWNWVEKHIDNPITAKHFLFKNGLEWMKTGVKLDSVYNLMTIKFTETKMREDIQTVYNGYKPIARGQSAPNFELPNVKGNLVSLENFRGKLVYIDFWGTYCKPCFNLVPALNQLEAQFHGKDIVFIGIGMDKDDPLWLKRIEQFHMGGIQLRSESREHPFLRHFKVFGIPRFVLLDKEGKIIDAYAKEPDDPELIDQLKTLLI